MAGASIAALLVRGIVKTVATLSATTTDESKVTQPMPHRPMIPSAW